jgi:hypothetical protein
MRPTPTDPTPKRLTWTVDSVTVQELSRTRDGWTVRNTKTIKLDHTGKVQG